MPKRFVMFFALLALFAAAFISAQNSGSALLQQARARKTAGELQAATQGFEKVIADFATTDRNAAANALLELADLAQVLGQTSRARGFYDRVRADYKDQRAEARAADERMAEMMKQDDPVRVTIKTPYTEDPFSFALSPDGRTLVMQVTTPEGKRQLWRQLVDPSRKPEPIAGTDGAGINALPFFSPDGRSVAYFANQKLWQIDLAGGTAKALAEAPTPGGGAWSRKGIVFSGRGFFGALESLQEGRSVKVTTAPGYFVAPHFMDDNRFLYFARDSRGMGKIEIGSLEGGAPLPARGMPAAQAGTYSQGHLLFVSDGRLTSLKFDPQALVPSGASMIIADRIGKEARFPGAATISASLAGPIAYRENAAVTRRLAWINRAGSQTGALGTYDAASPGKARVSPDGKNVLFFRQAGVAALGSIWVMDTAGGAARQLRDAANRAIWSADGEHILFAALTNGGNGPLMLDQPIALGANNAGKPVGPTTGSAFPEDWARNGSVLYSTGSNAGDVMVLPPDGGTPVPVAATSAAERNARFSPNGSWIAYQSDESGRNEIYVQPYPGQSSQRQRVSLAGGSNPQWNPKRQELYFLSPDNYLMLAEVVSPPADTRTLEFATPKPLFEKALPLGSEYETAPDGERFLVIEPSEDAPPIVVLSNWAPKR